MPISSRLEINIPLPKALPSVVINLISQKDCAAILKSPTVCSYACYQMHFPLTRILE